MSLSFSYFCKVLRFALIQRHCLIRPSDVVGIGLIFYSGYFFFFRTIHNRVMTSYPFLKMAATILIPVSVFVISLIWEGRNILAYKF